MFFWLACGLFALALAAAAAGFRAHLRALDARCQFSAAAIETERYQVFIRLLRNLDNDLPDDERKRAGVKAERRERVRAYLRALTKDYGRVLQQLRVIAVDSNTDRPDLISILERNRLTFAWMMCRIDLHLCLDRWGLGNMDLVTRDVIELVDGFQAIQLRTKFFTESAVWGH
ncbi:MAG TPA: hypothetical protein VHC90_18305 [Bryobacteraceae bacterium]|nr:hypothetical protein [Bryobacteraceae bacterium]